MLHDYRKVVVHGEVYDVAVDAVDLGGGELLTDGGGLRGCAGLVGVSQDGFDALGLLLRGGAALRTLLAADDVDELALLGALVGPLDLALLAVLQVLLEQLAVEPVLGRRGLLAVLEGVAQEPFVVLVIRHAVFVPPASGPARVRGPTSSSRRPGRS